MDKKERLLLLFLLLLVSFLLVLFIHSKRKGDIDARELAAEETVTDASEKLIAHFIDVGQGDAIFLQGPDFSIMIDAGRHDRDEVLPYLKSLNINFIDLLVGTHPHADHIGQFPQILENIEVREVWMSGDVHTTRTFERAIDAILATDAIYREPRAGDEFTFGSARVYVAHPEEITGKLNNGSLVIRLNYGDVSFLFTGDAEMEAEAEMLARGEDLQAHVLKLGHHGSQTSSTREFLNQVNPEVAIYSAGWSNPYNHPHPDVIRRLNKKGILVYGTDQNGTIFIESDGISYRIITFEDDIRINY